MKIKKASLEGLLLLEPTFWNDTRGSFFEAFRAESFKGFGLPQDFPQDNMSISKKGVVRGLHFQTSPFEQGKVVRCVRGAIYDVAVDIRKDSPTYGMYDGFELSEKNQYALYIPPGFAHGFQALEDDSTIWYKCTQVFSKDHDRGVSAFDPKLKIMWPLPISIVSEKDQHLPLLENYRAM